MAIFNPDVPEKQAPSYLSYSKPISDVEGDKSVGVALKGLGDIVTMGVNAADTTIKDSIDSQLYARLDQEREKYTQGLEQGTGVPENERIASPLNILDSNKEETPPPMVQAAIKSAEKVQNASVLGADAPSIYYTGRQAMIQKDVRAQWPGYREYIDRKVAQITGGNPANEYIQKVEHAIRASRSGEPDQLKADLALIRQNADNINGVPGLPDASIVYQKRLTGQIGSPEVLDWVGKGTKWKTDAAKSQAQRDAWKGSREQLVEKTKEDWDRQVSGLTELNQWVMGNGENMSIADVADMVESMRTNKDQYPLNDQAGQQLLEIAMANKQNVLRRIDMLANNRNKDDPNSKSPKDILGSGYINERLKDQLFVYDTIIDNIKNKEYGLAHTNTNWASAASSDLFKEYTAGKNVPEAMRNFYVNQNVMKKFGTETGAAAFNDLLMDRSITDDVMKNVTRDTVQRVITPAAKDPITLNDAISKFKSMKIGIPNSNEPATDKKKAEAQIYNHLLGVQRLISNPKVADPVRMQTVNSVYGPGNDNLVFQFDKDKYDDKGRFIPGYNTIFQRFTDAETSKSVFEIANKNHDMQAWYNYKGWAEITHRNLFSQNTKDLNTMVGDGRVKFEFNDQTMQVRAIVTSGNPKIDASPSFQKFKKGIESQTEMVSRGLQSMANIARTEGNNPLKYVMEEAIATGADVQQGYGKLILEAMKNSIPQKKETK